MKNNLNNIHNSHSQTYGYSYRGSVLWHYDNNNDVVETISDHMSSASIHIGWAAAANTYNQEDGCVFITRSEYRRRRTVMLNKYNIKLTKVRAKPTPMERKEGLADE